jgi:hypothetical protein
MLPSNWPHWIIIPVGFSLAVASIGLGLVLEPAVQSLAEHPEPTPTMPCLEYAAPLSGECVDCHTDSQEIQVLAASEGERQRLLIETAAIESIHGRLGCVTCHGGTSGTDDVRAAHNQLVADPSSRYEATCLLCHRDLRHPTSDELLHVPHQAVLGSPTTVTCSECHGAVGHGFNAPAGETICSMASCLDCHEERDLEVQSQDCGSCHIGPHDVAIALSCSDCHTSIQNWNETRLSLHPVALTGRHAGANCFGCHKWPDFGSLDYVCSDCHARPHSFGSDDCSVCHAPEGWSTSAMPGHDFPLEHGGSDGDCSVCHIGGDTSTAYCLTCHGEVTTVDWHEARGIIDVLSKCVACHPEG